MGARGRSRFTSILFVFVAAIGRAALWTLWLFLTCLGFVAGEGSAALCGQVQALCASKCRFHVHVLSCVFSYVCSQLCALVCVPRAHIPVLCCILLLIIFHVFLCMFAFMCVVSKVCPDVQCALACVLSFFEFLCMLSYVCSHVLSCHFRILMCAL